MARTGSGKTAAFLLPMLQRLMDKENNLTKPPSSGPRVLIMSPTRELALQTFKFTKQVNWQFSKIHFLIKIYFYIKFNL
jgi:ATP-dependent RNA helicase DDX54/DBP10